MTPSLFNYVHSSSYSVKYIGEVLSVSSGWVDEDKPQSVLKVIEMAQVMCDTNRLIMVKSVLSIPSVMVTFLGRQIQPIKEF